jgi:hypothetical protein
MEGYEMDIDHFATISNGSAHVRHEGVWNSQVILGLLRDADERYYLNVAMRDMA